MPGFGSLSAVSAASAAAAAALLSLFGFQSVVALHGRPIADGNNIISRQGRLSETPTSAGLAFRRSPPAFDGKVRPLTVL